MKKILLALVALMFAAAPAWAAVTITAEADGCVVTVGFDALTEANLVRAFSLDIQLDNDANILEVDDTINADYYIFPGTIQIDASGNVTSYGTAVGEVSDSPDTLPGLDSNGVTIEMASLYAPVGLGSPNAPDPCGPLVILTVDKNTCITISGNVARAGNTGVVMENPDDNPTVNLTGCCVEITVPPICTTCRGDVDGDGWVVLSTDYVALRNALVATAPDYYYECGSEP